MADMRPPVPGAGRPPARKHRRAFLAAVAVLALGPGWTCAAAAPPEPEAAARLLVPWQTFFGARLVERVDPTGQIRPGQGGGFVRFRYPTAVAARGPDLYVADSGAGTLYRFDAALQAMQAVPGVRALPGTRIRVGADHTLFVLDPGAGRLRRFSRDGTPLQTLSDAVAAARFSDFSLDETGRIYVLDALGRRIVAFHPAGRAASVFASAMEGGGELQAMGAIAGGAVGLLVADSACRCVLRLGEDGQVAARLGEGDLRQPGAIAMDREGRVFVADAFDQSLKVFGDGVLLASFAAAALGASGIAGIAIDEGFLYVADGAGARIVVLRIRPGSRRGP